MRVEFRLEEYEERITPIKVVDSLIGCGIFNNDMLELIAESLLVYTKHMRFNERVNGEY